MFRARPFAVCLPSKRLSEIAFSAVVSDEHAREAKNRPRSAAERRRECVKSLLAGELVDRSELDYNLDAHHLAMMVKGEGGEQLMRGLAKELDRRLLAVHREEEPIWACWLGGRRPLEVEQVMRALSEISLPDGVFVTVGEPGEGLSGWRFSHRQAKAALPIAERRVQPILRYSDVALLASVLRDDLGATSLRRLYLEPLERARDGGKVGPRDSARLLRRGAKHLLDGCRVGRRSSHGHKSHSRDRGSLRSAPQGFRDGVGNGIAAGRLTPSTFPFC